MAYNCESPRAQRYEALQTYIGVRCRKCSSCLKARQWLWRIRAAREQVAAKHTWFVTLTFGRNARARILADASSRDDGASQADRLTRAAGWFVGNYCKRLRKSGFKVRYVWFAEPHANGFPHFHGLIHDQTGTLSEAQRAAIVAEQLGPLESAWSAGSQVVVLPVRDGGAIFYVTKYIAKGRFGRIRASASYGGEQSLIEARFDSALAWRNHVQTIVERLGRRDDDVFQQRHDEKE